VLTLFPCHVPSRTVLIFPLSFSRTPFVLLQVWLRPPFKMSCPPHRDTQIHCRFFFHAPGVLNPLSIFILSSVFRRIVHSLLPSFAVDSRDFHFFRPRPNSLLPSFLFDCHSSHFPPPPRLTHKCDSKEFLSSASPPQFNLARPTRRPPDHRLRRCLFRPPLLLPIK